jgi:DNA-binding XRE family transcriptional regulator
MDLAEKIIEFRAVNKMTQEEFATAVGIDRTSILHIEARNRVPRKVTAKRVEIFIDNYNKEKENK